MARVRLTGSAPWMRVLPILVRTIPLPHLFAAYGPVDYEILFLDTQPNEVARLVEQLARVLVDRDAFAAHLLRLAGGCLVDDRDARLGGAA